MKQRSGQRAFSESEAQAYSHIINTIGKVLQIGSHFMSVLYHILKYVLILPITLIIIFSIFHNLVPGASVTSMSSTGSYTDNPGYHTLRTIHNR